MNNQVNSKGIVFVVDDNPTNVDMLFDCLDHAGFDVFVAVDGESAIERIESVKPDLILLDIMMPGIDGFETCRRLQANDETKDIPIIFITALSDAPNKVKGLKMGAVDYVTKPFQYEEVLARVTTHLTIYNLQKKLQKQNIKLQKQTVELQAKTHELESRNKELDAFAHTVAHELKTPLTMVIGYVQLLQAKQAVKSLPELKNDLETILSAGFQMVNITDELMLLSKLHNANITLMPLNMRHIVTESLNRLTYLISEYNAEINLPDVWDTAMGYSPWLVEVWVNYLSNALKYGGRPPQVKLGSTVQTDGYVRFWVQDNGQGISLEEQSELFTEFTQLKHLEIEGHGLGLSIVQRIVKRLGGQVGVDSQVGQGSIFYFTLPQIVNQD